jgi:DNA helicase-2/ATP-dependent DNA helicase PcrA
VLARRTLVIREGRLERIEAPEGVFAAKDGAPGGWERIRGGPARLTGGEGSALRVYEDAASGEPRLGSGTRAVLRGADKRLPEITGLIDPAQFDLIARPRPGFLVIRGAAGSGKTTVALHRIAYLAYDDPAIDSPETLFVVFSPALRRYVGHVLPGLGVEGVRISTYQEWAGLQRRRHFPRLPSGTRLEAPSLVQRMKLHPALGAALAQQVRDVPGRAEAEQALDDWASVLIREDLLREVFAREAPDGFGAGDVRRFVEWNRRQNDELFRWLAGEPETEGALEPEDDALLLRAWQLRVGPLRGAGKAPLRYRHVAIDEVQDFSPLEVRVLLDCLDRDRSITLAGDTQQHVVEGSGFTSWGDFLGDLGVSGAEIETLRVSYRSSREIVDFALAVLGPLREDELAPLATRSGPPVEFFRFTERGACVAFLADALRRLAEEEPLASVALLTPSEAESALYHQGLLRSDVPRLRRVQEQDFTFAPGIEVTEIDQAKGLEFDYVLVVEVNDEHFPDAPGARRLLHVAATRAVHQLWLASVGAPSPLVAGLAG